MWDRILFIWRTGWDLHPSLLLLIGLGCGVYIYGLRGWRPPEQPVPGNQIALFASGMLVLVFTLQSPLHHLAEAYLFSAHMTQHLLLTMAVPPLVLLGTPEWMAKRALNSPMLARFGRTQAYPVIAFAAFHIPFMYLHFPGIYETAFGIDLVHRLTHLFLLATGLLTWMPLLSPAPSILPRLSLPAQMLYAFVQTLPGQLVRALVTLSAEVLYTKYAFAPTLLDVNPVDDQQLGGLIMWVVGGTFWLVVLTVLFFVWAHREVKRPWG